MFILTFLLWKNMPHPVWEFTLGGYQVIEEMAVGIGNWNCSADPYPLMKPWN